MTQVKILKNDSVALIERDVNACLQDLNNDREYTSQIVDIKLLSKDGVGSYIAMIIYRKTKRI